MMSNSNLQFSNAMQARKSSFLDLTIDLCIVIAIVVTTLAAPSLLTFLLG
ncbi:MAG: hypothetical protein ACFB9N_18870 [Geitlerinemataceae cyanobacterium]